MEGQSGFFVLKIHLCYRFEDELNSDDVENMRWATFVAFNRQVGDETFMTGRANIVQVREEQLILLRAQDAFFRGRFRTLFKCAAFLDGQALTKNSLQPKINRTLALTVY